MSAEVVLSVVIPAYRQEATIVEDIQRIDRTLRTAGVRYELLVVIDGFVDNSYERAQSVASEHIRILGYGQNGGKGHAVRFGLRQASGDIVAFIDAGMDLDPSGIGLALDLLHNSGADIAIGSKRHPESQVNYPPIRRLYSVVYQALVWLLFGLNVRDTQVGLKVFRQSVIADIEPLLLVKRFAFDVEMLVVAAQMGHHRIVEFPVTLTHGQFSSSIRLRSVFEMLWDTAAVFYRARIMRYYQKLAAYRRDAAVSSLSANATNSPRARRDREPETVA